MARVLPTRVYCSLLLWSVLLYNNVECAPVEESINNVKTELQLVQVVFRHGERTPDPRELLMYPNNPNINATYEPIGLSALTNGGKMREFIIGEYLKSQYKNFLSTNYKPKEIYVRTTDYDRTKMSALLCLAGMYPPGDEEKWNPSLNWQPIPYNVLPRSDDDMVYFESCPRFLEIMFDMKLSKEYLKIWNGYKDVTDKLSLLIGRNLTGMMDVMILNSLLNAEASWGFPSPGWADEEMMKHVIEITNMQYFLQHSTDELKQITAGQLLYKMLQDFQAKINGTIFPPERKIFLYSAHDLVVSAILAASGVFKPHQPPYGATYILELHKVISSQTYAVRILYAEDVTKETRVLSIPKCGSLCDVNKFIALTANVVTPDFKTICVAKNY